MRNEKQSNNENWICKLDNLDSLPGEDMPDKNELWEKLHSRLSERKNVNKVIWYWVAAACILFALMIPLIFSNNKFHQLVKDKIKDKQPGIKILIGEKPGKRDSNKVLNSALSGETIVTVLGKSYKNGSLDAPSKQTREFRLYDTVSMQNLVTETINKAVHTVDTAARFVTIIPVKKKLPVVHINELGDPANVPEEVARNSDKHSFLLFKLASQEVYTNSSISTTKDFATINLKTPSN